MYHCYRGPEAQQACLCTNRQRPTAQCLLYQILYIHCLWWLQHPREIACIITIISQMQKRRLGASQVAQWWKNPPAKSGDARDTGSIPGWRTSPGGGNGNPLQCSCLENPMDREAWRTTVHGVAELCLAPCYVPVPFLKSSLSGCKVHTPVNNSSSSASTLSMQRQETRGRGVTLQNQSVCFSIQRTRCLDGITDSMDMSLCKLWEIVKDRGSLACCSPWGCKESDKTATEQQQLCYLIL